MHMLNKIKQLNNPVFLTRFHASMTIIWICLIVPTLLFFPDSILWLALMSLWANMAAHWAAYQGVHSEKVAAEDAECNFNDIDSRLEKLEGKLDEIISMQRWNRL